MQNGTLHGPPLHPVFHLLPFSVDLKINFVALRRRGRRHRRRRRLRCSSRGRRRRRRRRLFLSPLSSVSSFSFSFASPPFPQFCVRVSSRQVGRRSAAEGNERGRDTGEEEKSGAVRETPQRVTAFNLVLQTLAAS